MAEPVRDWASDYDIFDPAYVRDPAPIWDELRRSCPVAHTDRWGGSHLLTTYAHVTEAAHDPARFSSAYVLVAPPALVDPADAVAAPPITSDPPEHSWARRLILPAFSPQAVARHEPATRELCRSLVEGFAGAGRADAAADYAQQIPVRVISALLGLPEDRADEFTGWVRGVLELGLADPELRVASRAKIIAFFAEQVERRRAEPGEDLISLLLAAEVDGGPVPTPHVIGTCLLLLLAGVDTTWSAIGACLWHLAAHPGDRRRLVEEPALLPTAVEELLRAYSPVTMGRVVTRDTTLGGCAMRAGERVLLSFPAANRDPSAFPDADRVMLDRAHNRHVAFGVGIHRCAGSNLARMELRVALEEWLVRLPEFELEDPAAVTWAGGQVRGPRRLPVRWARG